MNEETRAVTHNCVNFKILHGILRILGWNVADSFSNMGNSDRSFGKKLRHCEVTKKKQKQIFLLHLGLFSLFVRGDGTPAPPGLNEAKNNLVFTVRTFFLFHIQHDCSPNLNKDHILLPHP